MKPRFAPGSITQTTYSVTLIVSAMLFYLLATGRTGWYFYVMLGFLVLERALIALVQWIATMYLKQRASAVMAHALAHAQAAMPDNPTLGPIHGGSIEHPEGEEDEDAK